MATHPFYFHYCSPFLLFSIFFSQEFLMNGSYYEAAPLYTKTPTNKIRPKSIDIYMYIIFVHYLHIFPVQNFCRPYNPFAVTFGKERIQSGTPLFFWRMEEH